MRDKTSSLGTFLQRWLQKRRHCPGLDESRGRGWVDRERLEKIQKGLGGSGEPPSPPTVELSELRRLLPGRRRRAGMLNICSCRHLKKICFERSKIYKKLSLRRDHPQGPNKTSQTHRRWQRGFGLAGRSARHYRWDYCLLLKREVQMLNLPRKNAVK